MASQTNTDRIGRLEQSLAKFEEQIVNLRETVREISRRLERLEESAHVADKWRAILDDRLDRLEKRLDEQRSRRWEIWRIVLTAVLSSVLGLLVGRFLK